MNAELAGLSLDTAVYHALLAGISREEALRQVGAVYDQEDEAEEEEEHA